MFFKSLSRKGYILNVHGFRTQMVYSVQTIESPDERGGRVPAVSIVLVNRASEYKRSLFLNEVRTGE